MVFPEKIRLLIPALLVVLLLSSCIPPHALYLRNFLTTEIAVVLRFKDKKQLDDWRWDEGEKLAIRKNVSSFSKTRSGLFKDIVEGKMTDSLTMAYKIPALSVARFGNAWYLCFDRIDLMGENLNKTFFSDGRYTIDNITGEKEEVKFGYKWLGHYFFDVKNKTE